ncbi:hypothetical protein CsSME_00036838 [Camellia sinensis var. sinensis]
MDTTRLCVVFEDRHILSKAQKSQGLNQSWILLKPQHHNISDLSTYLTHIFDVHHSCPNGIILSVSLSLSLSPQSPICSNRLFFTHSTKIMCTILFLLYCIVYFGESVRLMSVCMVKKLEKFTLLGTP